MTIIMNRISKLFEEKKQNILSVYFTAGFPKPDDTVTIIHELQNAGADLIEIGMPFSDPLADGVIIQQSSRQALNNGMSISLLFKQLGNIRENVNIPLILMGYLNPVLQYGIEEFCKKSAELGIDGVIIPDLPLQEYEEEYQSIFEKYGLFNIFLISPETSEERIRQIDNVSNGFIYMVSSSSTTGIKGEISNSQEEYFKRIKSMKLNNPALIGFGISGHSTYTKACEYACGVIIGSAFIKALTENDNIKETIHNFIGGIKNI